MALLTATHETGFACEVADRLVFMDADEIVEVAGVAAFFGNPETERAKLFQGHCCTFADGRPGVGSCLTGPRRTRLETSVPAAIHAGRPLQVPTCSPSSHMSFTIAHAFFC